jgi:hypothetical protein
LRQLESECFAECSSGTIQLPVGLEALPNSCFMAADIEELTFEYGSVLGRITVKHFCQYELKTKGYSVTGSRTWQTRLLACE